MWDTNERPNSQIIGINEGEISKVNSIDKILKKAITSFLEMSPN